MDEATLLIGSDIASADIEMTAEEEDALLMDDGGDQAVVLQQDELMEGPESTIDEPMDECTSKASPQHGSIHISTVDMAVVVDECSMTSPPAASSSNMNSPPPVPSSLAEDAQPEGTAPAEQCDEAASKEPTETNEAKQEVTECQEEINDIVQNDHSSLPGIVDAGDDEVPTDEDPIQNGLVDSHSSTQEGNEDSVDEIGNAIVAPTDDNVSSSSTEETTDEAKENCHNDEDHADSSAAFPLPQKMVTVDAPLIIDETADAPLIIDESEQNEEPNNDRDNSGDIIPNPAQDSELAVDSSPDLENLLEEVDESSTEANLGLESKEATVPLEDISVEAPSEEPNLEEIERPVSRESDVIWTDSFDEMGAQNDQLSDDELEKLVFNKADVLNLLRMRSEQIRKRKEVKKRLSDATLGGRMDKLLQLIDSHNRFFITLKREREELQQKAKADLAQSVRRTPSNGHFTPPTSRNSTISHNNTRSPPQGAANMVQQAKQLLAAQPSPHGSNGYNTSHAVQSRPQMPNQMARHSMQNNNHQLLTNGQPNHAIARTLQQPSRPAHTVNNGTGVWMVRQTTSMGVSSPTPPIASRTVTAPVARLPPPQLKRPYQATPHTSLSPATMHVTHAVAQSTPRMAPAQMGERRPPNGEAMERQCNAAPPVKKRLTDSHEVIDLDDDDVVEERVENSLVLRLLACEDTGSRKLRVDIAKYPPKETPRANRTLHTNIVPHIGAENISQEYMPSVDIETTYTDFLLSKKMTGLVNFRLHPAAVQPKVHVFLFYHVASQAENEWHQSNAATVEVKDFKGSCRFILAFDKEQHIAVKDEVEIFAVVVVGKAVRMSKEYNFLIDGPDRKDCGSNDSGSSVQRQFPPGAIVNNPNANNQRQMMAAQIQAMQRSQPNSFNGRPGAIVHGRRY